MSTRPTIYTPFASRAVMVAATVIVVAALYWGRQVLVPLTLAVFFAFLLSPLVNRVKSWGIGHVPAVILVGGFALVALLIIAFFLTVQVANIASNLPAYTAGAREKLRVVIGPLEGLAGRASQSVHQLTAASAPATSETAQAPPVRIIRESDSSAMIIEVLRTLVAPLGMFAVVAVLAGAILMQGSDLRDRVVRLVGDRQITMTTKALDEVAARVSRYLLVQTAINGTQGLIVAGGLTLIGVPNALLWGLLWAILRYLPYVGVWLGAALPILTALGSFQGWTQPLLVISMFVVIEVASNTFFEPWLYGSGTGLSPLAVLVSAVFWAWVWGPPGLILATPMTVFLAVLGQYVKQLEFLYVLLGDKPVLQASVRLYQRLLLNNAEDARTIIQAELAEQGTAATFEDVVVPALVLVDEDAQRGLHDEAKVAEILQLTRQILAALPPVTRGQPALKLGRCLCVPARDDFDVICGEMLQRYFAERGLDIDILENGYLANEKAELVVERAPETAMVAALSTNRSSYVRHTLRRIAERSERVGLVAAVFDRGDDGTLLQDRVGDPLGAIVANSFASALDAVRFTLMSRKSRAAVGAVAAPDNGSDKRVKPGTGVTVPA